MNLYLIIKTYKKLWRLDYKIYALGSKIRLPRALPVRLASYFGIAVFFMLQANKLPFVALVPFAIKAAMTLGIAALLDTVKLDGKNPIRYFGGCLRFLLFERGVRMEHFKEREKIKSMSMDWAAGSQGLVPAHAEKTIRIRWTGGRKGGNIFV